MKRNNLLILKLKEWFQNSSDIVLQTKSYKTKFLTYSLAFLYCPNLVDTKAINETILPTINEAIGKEGGLTIERLSNLIGITKLRDFENIKNEIEQRLFSGECVILNEETMDIFFIPVSNFPKRSPEESNIETSARGPRDGFVENISDNMTLIRQRLKTTSLKSIEYTIGERSKTKVLLLYMEDIINPSILNEVQSRLRSITIDILISSNQLEEMIYDHPYSIFPLMDAVGRPDHIVQSLNQGRFAILVDGNPTVLIGPTSLTQLLISPEDVHNSFFYISFVRLLRIFALGTTIFLPGFFIALVTFQTEQIPFTLIATIAMSRKGLPLSATMEAFIMITMFELFKEAGLRLPKAVGTTVAVLGGLIIGDAAIRAGLTSASLLVVISITVISGYTLINQNLAGNVLLLRYLVLFLSSMFGIYGFFLSFYTIITLAISLESFGQPYLSVYAFPNSQFLKSFIKLPNKLLKKRNHAYQPMDTTRQKE
ncbi:spore germination protein [Neobacillus niacini]|uniref:spore germination protein n=1 Tax=Neobacillus niacini TaxID=86668 RepID=UPI002FFF12D3